MYFDDITDMNYLEELKLKIYNDCRKHNDCGKCPHRNGISDPCDLNLVTTRIYLLKKERETE